VGLEVTTLTHYLKPSSGSVVAQIVVLPVGTALSGVLTWILFSNLYGAVAFVALFAIGVVAEAVRQRHAKAERSEADVAMAEYISRLHEAARESGLDLNSPPRDGI